MRSKTPVRPPIRKDGDGHKSTYSYSYKYGYGYRYGYGYEKEKRPRELNKRLLIVTILLVAVLGPAVYYWHDFKLKDLSKSLLTYAAKMEAEENWPAASQAYYRVYEISKDPEVLGKLAPAYDKHASDTKLRGVIASYQKAVGELPDRKDLRLRLSELLLRDNQADLALEHSEIVLSQDNQNASAIKWNALAHLTRLRNGNPTEQPGQVRDFMKNACIANPADLQLAAALTTFLRSDLKATNDSEDGRLATAVLDHLVASDPNNAKSLLARSRYRSMYELPGAQRDLDRAIAIAPNDPVVVKQVAFESLQDAATRQRRGDFMTSRELFRKLVELEPKQSSGYIGLGDTAYLSGDIANAIQTWRQGVKNAGMSLPLLLRIAEGETNSLKFDDAERTMLQVEQMLASATRHSVENRKWATASTALFRGLIHLAQDRPYEAIPKLQVAAALGRESTGLVQSNKSTSFTAAMRLGQTYEELGQGEEAAVAYDRALVLQPESAEALLSAANAWAKLGDIDRAIAYTERALQQADVSRDAYRQLAQYHLERQLALPSDQRNWSDCESALQSARTKLANSWKLNLVELDFQIHKEGTEATLSRTLAKLLSVERNFPNEQEVWKRLPLIYESLGQTSEADRTLNKLEEISKGSLTSKILVADVMLSRGKPSAARRVLEEVSVDDLSKIDRWKYELAQLRIVESEGDRKSIDETILRLINEYEKATFPVERMLDRRLSNASVTESPSNEMLLAMLKQRQAEQEPYWQYYAARFELAKANPSTEELNILAGALRNQVPYWTRTQEILGRTALLRGDTREARLANGVAASRPDANPELFRLIIEQNAAVNDHLANIRFVDRYRQLSSLSSLLKDGSWSQVQRDLDFAAVNSGLPQDVAENDFVWSKFVPQSLATSTRKSAGNDLASLLFRLRDATESNDKTQQQLLMSQIKSVVHPSQDINAFVMGQALHISNEFAKARVEFERVPSDSKLRLLAELYSGIAANELAKQKNARPVSSGALASQSQRRLNAIVKLRRGAQGDLEEAKRLLTSLLDESIGDDNDRLLLAKCLEELGETAAAKAELEAIVADAPTAQHMANMADFLLRTGESEEAKVWIERLEQQSGWTKVSVSLGVRWMAATGREDRIESFVEEYARQLMRGRTADELPGRMREIAEIYRSVEMTAEAKQWLSLLAERFPEHAEAYSFLLIDSNETERAIQQCVEQFEDLPTAETAALLARILVYGKVNKQTQEEVQPLLDRSIELFPNNASLLFATGNLHLKMGDKDKAIDLLDRVTKVRPSHYLAWNNLAALLAEEEGRQGEAMDKIENAIAQSAYKVPTLLDTKAVVLIHQDKFQDAADLLQQEVTNSEAATDARFYFHLALALEKTAERKQAIEALNEANNLGLDKAFLTAFETEELSRLQKTLGTSNE